MGPRGLEQSTELWDVFNSDDHYINYCGSETLRTNAVAIIVNRKVRNAVLGRNLKNNRQNDEGKPFKTTVIQGYAPTSNAKEAEVEQFYEDTQDFLELPPKGKRKKKMSFSS